MLTLVLVAGCGQQISMKLPNATHEVHTRTTLDLGGVGAKTAIGTGSEAVMQGNMPVAPQDSDVPQPMFGTGRPPIIAGSNARNY